MLRIFTDGACSGNPGPGGWGAVLLLPEGIQEVSGFAERTTNNRMELRAVIHAIGLAVSLGFEELSIHSDSAYVVDAINKTWIHSWKKNNWTKKSDGEEIKNKDLWIQLYKLISSIYKNKGRVKFVKVKGHSGDTLNNMADNLARREIRIAMGQEER